jgi:two-component system NtrC family sensor kinase
MERRCEVAHDLEGSSILIVDDFTESLRLLSTILRRGGFVPRPVTSGALAIEAATMDPPDLVLLDVQMPELSGLDVCRKFKQDPRLRDIPIIFISAIESVEEKAETFRAGGVDYVCKPFNAEDVLDRVGTHLRLRRTRADLISHTAPYTTHPRHTVLVVDDDSQFLRILAEILSRDDCDVLTAQDAEQALALLKTCLPCMILLDVELPGMNGLALCRRIKQDPSTAHIPIALVTARVGADDVNAGIAAGAVDYIKKPFDVDEVRMRVRMQIRLHEAMIEQQCLHEHLSVISETAKDAILIIGNSGKTLHWNEAAERMFGYTRAEALGQDLHTLIAPVRFHSAQSKAFQVFRANGQGAGIGKTLEMAAIRKSGEEFPVELSLASAKLKGEWCAVGIVHDITERKRAKAALRESERHHQATFEQAAVGMAVVGADGKMLRVNRRLCEIVGYPADELLALRFADITHPDDLAIDLEASRALRAGTIHNYSREKRYLRKDGSVVWIKLAVATVRDTDGHFDHFVSVYEDITEHKLAETALRESEEKYRGIFNASRDAILTLVPPTWRFVDANPACLAMFKAKTVEEFTSHGPIDLSPENQHDGRPSSDAALEKIQTAMREGTASFEWTHRRLDGQEFPAAVLLNRMDRGGKQFLQGTVRDLSEQKSMEIQLGHARKLEAVGQLASGIAHEINTPTQYVGDGVHFLKEAFEGYRQLVSQYQRAVATLEVASGHEDLVSDIRKTEEAIDLPYLEANAPGSFESCQDGISRISTIVRAMKEFAHPDRKEKVPANLNQALQTTLAIARNEYKYVADLTTEFGDLPPVLCHVGDLNQVFLNLIVNASHAIGDVVGQSGGKGTIHIKTWLEGDLARIDIADSGAGVPVAIRQRIFEPFFTTKAVGKGTGQGLAIAHSIVVTKHGGSLSFESEVGKGTTFTIRLPIGDGADGRGGT